MFQVRNKDTHQNIQEKPSVQEGVTQKYIQLTQMK